MKSKISALLLIFFSLFIFQNCKTSKTATASEDNAGVKVSYIDDIRPLMVRSCTPCHFPENGRKIMLDDYEATVAEFDDIIKRVEMAPTAPGFMPFKSKRTPLTKEEIALFKAWAKQGMPE